MVRLMNYERKSQGKKVTVLGSKKVTKEKSQNWFNPVFFSVMRVTDLNRHEAGPEK